WDFHDFPGAVPVEVLDVVENEKIVLQWEAFEESGDDGDVTGAGYHTRMTIEFTALEEGRTLVTIAEQGWREDEHGLKSSYGNCEGWTQMLCSLKMWVEHGINLRADYYK
ncbi:MAG: SRPBCC domain-containing protein, partial [Pseudomonadota bacterium]